VRPDAARRVPIRCDRDISALCCASSEPALAGN
jgi:hypothetical protein